MKLKNYLVNLLSNIIHDRLNLLAETKNDMKKTSDYKKIEDLFSNVDNLVDVDEKFLRDTLSDVTEEDNIDEIISTVDMIKIVLKGKSEGLELDVDSSQKDVVKGVYDIVNKFRTELETKNQETRDYLEDFISKCQSLSDEIGSGVVRDLDTLDEIFSENDVPLEDIIKAKYEILRNNSKNYNTKLEGNVKEEVALHIIFKKIDFDYDSFSDLEKSLLLGRDKEVLESIVDFISQKNLNLDKYNLFMLLMFADVNNLNNIVELCESYNMSFERLLDMPGIFISNTIDLNSIVNSYKDDKDFSCIERFQYIDPSYELFVDNIALLEANNISVGDCYKSNMLSLIVPDLSKNITILSGLDLSNKDFSIIVLNPFLATSMSGFKECGLSEYIDNNPIRLTTSYYRLRNISTNIINARKNGRVIFRSLSDKKNYWLTKEITRGSEVI